MNDKRLFLKVKLKSLMSESKIIRKEELKHKRTGIQGELHHHRTQVVRHEARLTHLAYAYIRGKEWPEQERYQFTKKDMEKIEGMVKKYGLGPYHVNLQTWVTNQW